MNIDAIMELEELKFIVDFIKIYFIILCTYYTSLKLIDITEYNVLKNIINIIIISIISIITKIIKDTYGFLYCVIFMEISISLIFYFNKRVKYINSLLIIIVSSSINYILFFISLSISFIFTIINIKNDYISLVIIILTYIIIVKGFFKIKKFKKGFSFLNLKLKSEYFDMLILNLSVIILFAVIILSNYKEKITGKLGIGLILLAIVMFITIQKSFQLYYKQKLLIQDLEETKKELENKKQEIEKLEKENLNFSKISHSIAHKQKSLEHKLNEILLKNETSSEIDIRDRINTIAKELIPKATLELSKTGITEIDDMLKYMQAECIKNKIEFELQISGNIHKMINNHVGKENLEILLADHIKNAIIAINYSDNSNKSILVRLGIIDGFYSLYIYDSGIEFEIETLKNLGKVPSTTHRESGGTGMGFMNTFDTLKKYKASMIINEYGHPSEDNYTKVLMIKFDRKNKFEIKSYRLEKMRR